MSQQKQWKMKDVTEDFIKGEGIFKQREEQSPETGQVDAIVILRPIKATVETLDDVKHSEKFKYFTVRNGKAKYHMLHVPDGTVGLYYALRVTDEGLGYRRALEPDTEITCWVAT